MSCDNRGSSSALFFLSPNVIALYFMPKKSRPIPEIKERKSGLGQPVPPTAFDTIYKNEFVWPTKISTESASKGQKQEPTSKVEDRQPMSKFSSNMMDYKDPKVTKRMPVRPSKDPYVHPTCRMESKTTTGISFPRWKDLPTQEVPKLLKDAKYDPGKNVTTFLVSTYQEDFCDLREALCPARTVENFGRLAIKPKYRFVCSGNGHEHYEDRHLKINKT
ncbi:uncharacterized protein NPIL_537341 [Nephila pilipes]|uniref:Uncharacterized protein n=1 Tax=Nephila pilipes TaxID=299642 RepID=A0A8X6U046_NEPPI|nr:uncharacterized protein NPIL_537341 [Nephila pilipes]